MSFTISQYRSLLVTAKQKFRFISFGDTVAYPAVALWRHDIDFSPQRALVLAKIEADLGIRATYFIQLASRYYSVFEPEIAAVLRQIAALGHAIGLHFDPEVCYHESSPDYAKRLSFEAATLAEILAVNVSAFSLHNPTTVVGGMFEEVISAGLINASSPVLREQFSYCSDSNGLWRYKSLEEMILDPSVRNLYTLTHPEWWQDHEMVPRDKIRRCVDGRADFCMQYYDQLLEVNSRPNIGKVVASSIGGE